MFRSVESMSTRELVYLMNKAFVLGFSIGSIGLICFFIFAFQKNENLLGLGAAAIIPLLLALLINMLYRRILGELSRRLGV
jgi:hypothetical protein